MGFTKKSFDGKIPDPEKFDKADEESEQKIKNFPKIVGALMVENHLDRALKKILEFSSHFNQYFQHKEPWKMGEGTNSCVYLSVNAVRSLAIALFSFMPNSAKKIYQQLGIDEDISSVRWDSIADISLKPNHHLGKIMPLFEKVEESDIKNHKQKLGTHN